MAKLIAVKFVRAHTPYAAGEIAGFEADEAKKLVKNEVAEYVSKKDLAALKADKDAEGGDKDTE